MQLVACNLQWIYGQFFFTVYILTNPTVFHGANMKRG